MLNVHVMKHCVSAFFFTYFLFLYSLGCGVKGDPMPYVRAYPEVGAKVEKIPEPPAASPVTPMPPNGAPPTAGEQK